MTQADKPGCPPRKSDRQRAAGAQDLGPEQSAHHAAQSLTLVIGFSRQVDDAIVASSFRNVASVASIALAILTASTPAGVIPASSRR